mgnify:CR=1 FL=1
MLIDIIIKVDGVWRYLNFKVTKNFSSEFIHTVGHLISLTAVGFFGLFGVNVPLENYSLILTRDNYR